MSAKVITFKARENCPINPEPAPPWLQPRLRHEAGKAATPLRPGLAAAGEPRLNEDAFAIGALWMCASNRVREQIWEFLRQNECTCLSCQHQRSVFEPEG